jgi:hypothetical protein
MQSDDDERLERQRAVGAELAKLFNRVSEEPVPPALQSLAEKLDERLKALTAEADGRLKDKARN